MPDTVSIRDLSVSAVIGAYDWERDVEQTLVFNVDMATDVAKAASTDQLADAVNYAAVAETITAVVRDGRFQLIETAAERVAERLLADFGLSWVRVEVVKPRPAEGFSATITIERPARIGAPGRLCRRSRTTCAHGVRSGGDSPECQGLSTLARRFRRCLVSGQGMRSEMRIMPDSYGAGYITMSGPRAHVGMERSRLATARRAGRLSSHAGNATRVLIWFRRASVVDMPAYVRAVAISRHV